MLTCFTGCAVSPPKDIPLTGAVSGPSTGPEDVLYQEKNSHVTGVWTDNYNISVGDKIGLEFPYKPEYSTDVTVLPDGTISVMLLGRIFAAGKTTRNLKEELSSGFLELTKKNDITDPADIQRKKYLIQPQDILDIKFSSHPDLDETLVVRPDGRITLRLVNTVIAEGKTPEKLQAELKELYSGHLIDRDLVVIVRETSSNSYYIDGSKIRPVIRDLDEINVVVRRYAQLQIYVGGEVKNPGFYDFGRPISALQAIITAGGTTDRSELRTVAIIRKAYNGKGMLYIRNLKSDRVGMGGESDNPIETAANSDMVLRPYDVIIVPISEIAATGLFVERYLYDIIPNLRNIVNFGFVYDLNSDSNN